MRTQMLRVWLAALFLVFGRIAAGQVASVPIDGHPACPTCKVVMHRVATLVAAAGSDGLDVDPPISRAASGHFAVVGASRQRILLFGPQGEFIRMVGTTGDGPGEFRHIAAVAYVGGDSLYVFDNRRFHVFDQRLKHVRTHGLAGPVTNAIVRQSGSMILGMRVNTPDGIGYPAHTVGPDGKIAKSFGSVERPRIVPGCVTCMKFVSRAPLTGNIVVYPSHRYEWSMWTVDGNAVAQYAVANTWFKPWEKPANWLSGGEPRNTALTQIGVDSVGRIWAGLVAPPRGWKPTRLSDAAGISVQPNGSVRSKSAAALREFLLSREVSTTETVIEVIDLEKRRVWASSRFQGAYRFLVWPYLSRRSTNASGDDQLEIFVARVVKH